MDLVTYLMGTEYGPYIVAVLTVVGALVTAASAIVPLTKTPKDDAILEKVKGFLQRFSLLKPKA